MENTALSHFEDLPISDSDKIIVNQSVKKLHFKNNETIFRQGYDCSEIYLTRSGLVKLSYLTLEGKEFIKSFIPAGLMFGSLYSLINGGGSTFSAIALEDVEIEALEFSILQKLTDNYPVLQKIVLNYFQQLVLKKEMREYELLCLSAQQRYEKFCQENPAILKKIKQADLALYLGITPIALSRMKHR